jgi:hypothetical protein
LFYLCSLDATKEKAECRISSKPLRSPSVETRSVEARRAGEGEARDSREMAPQRFEKIESAPGNGSASEVSNLQDLDTGARLTVRDSG